MAAAWRSLEPDPLLWAGWNGEFALYHRGSGKTHFVNGAAAHLITRVLREAKTSEAAARELAAAQDADADDAFFLEVEALLERLEQIGLVERRDD